jgi:hypothetical protein
MRRGQIRNEATPRIASAVLLLALTASSCAQGNQTIAFKTKSVRHLAGIVTYTDGAVVRGAIVSDCDPTYGHILASAKTGIDGRFFLPHARLGSKHFLKVDYPNFDEVHMPVRVSLFASNSVLIRLHVGT